MIYGTVTIDFELDGDTTPAEIYDIMKATIEGIGGVMTSCTPYIDKEDD